MHKWRPKKYSSVFVLISLTNLKIQKKSSFRTRLVGLISAKTKEYFFWPPFILSVYRRSIQWLLLGVTEHEYMQINESRLYVYESRGVIGPMFLRVRGFIGFVVSWASSFHRFHGFIGFVVP